MARKRPEPVAAPASKTSTVSRASITAERFSRLYKLLKILAEGPQPRSVLVKRLSLDVRGFYRDLELLRDAGIPVEITESRYTLTEELSTATARLPYPDPVLSLGEMQQLATGRTTVHSKLKEQIAALLE